jgi:hypothetical protein
VRTATVLLLAGLLTAGCTSSSGSGPAGSSASAPGCGMLPAAKVVGLLGSGSTSTPTGSLARLRSDHVRAGCRSVVPGHPDRAVTVVADYHPAPYPLPRKACSAGWVYAGTPEKFTPACQETVHGHGRTQLVVRWQPYLVRVTIDRPDRGWGGDPETALAMSRVLAQHLGVDEAAGEG